jgi:CubicO group peptidase (beta-lactamase class C family)
VVWANSYGYADLEEKIPLRNEHIYHLASLSKTVTALMQLYEKGLFKLDDDINRHMPVSVRNPDFPDKAITFRMLLTHTGSLEDVTSTGLKIPAGVEYPRGIYYFTGITMKNMSAVAEIARKLEHAVKSTRWQ